jgi:tRNA A-37 threonylcarbamoyl transferase component Bud32
MPVTSTPNRAEAPYERYSSSDYHGEVACGFRPPDLEAEVSRLVDPSSSTGTIHWGRNYIYAAELDGPGGPVPVVVKQFKNQGWKKRLERRVRGSKAERSWRVAKELLRHGLATPTPILWVESNEPEGPSFYVAEMLPNAVEIRQFFRRLNGDPGALEFPDVDDLQFLARLGRLARSINDAGILYRDLSMGNVLAVADNGGLDLYLIDFNRARIGRRPGVFRRTRDICRLPVIETAHRTAFLGGYWGTPPSRFSIRWWLYVVSVNGFVIKHVVKNRLKFLRLGRRHAHGGSHHPHIPAAAAGASVRDKAVWDHLSDQPHQHASSGEKLMIRIADSPAHLRDLAIVMASAPRVRRRYRDLRRALYAGPRPFTGIGLAVRPWPLDPDGQLHALDDLGVGPVLLRLHSWDDDHTDEERLAAALAAGGHEVAFVIAQNRTLVRDRPRWRAAVAELSERFLPYGRHFQIGQAINRSKWGIWTHGEYVDLYLEAAEIVRRHEGVELLGPPVIDFEFQALIALLNRSKPGLYFDVVSSLLYVDRRGAPENRQMGLDTVDKVTLLRAIAEVGRNSSDRCWITEVNWPLWEGPHSPAGKTVSVGEEEQADYLVRYYLLTLGTGLVERVYWWRLIARGYGLVAPASDGTLRRRPSWTALRTLVENVEGAVFNGPLPAPANAYLYAFERDGVETIVAWSRERGLHAELPRPASEIIDRDGTPVPVPDGTRIELGPSPVYCRLR